jgi:recombination protein RecT
MGTTSLPNLINQQRSQFALAIGGSTPQERQRRAERFTRICLTVIRQNPKLQYCTTESVLGAMMTCAQLDLEPNTPSGLAYLIPYGKECQFQVGYRGLLQLMYRSGAVSSFNADVVYRGEVEQGLFSYTSGVHPEIHHEIDLLNDSARTGKAEDIVAAYACVTLKGGEPVMRVITRKDILEARAKASARSQAWVEHFQAMAIKTAIKRLASWLPSTRMDEAFAAEEQTPEHVEAVAAAAEGLAVTSQPSLDALNAMLSGVHTATAEPEPIEAKPEQDSAQPKEPPFEPDSAPAEVPQPKPQATPAPGEKIRCPNSGKMVDDVADCPNCPHRQGCPQWD